MICILCFWTKEPTDIKDKFHVRWIILSETWNAIHNNHFLLRCRKKDHPLHGDLHNSLMSTIWLLNINIYESRWLISITETTTWRQPYSAHLLELTRTLSAPPPPILHSYSWQQRNTMTKIEFIRQRCKWASRQRRMKSHYRGFWFVSRRYPL